MTGSATNATKGQVVGEVRRVNGPIVEASGMIRASMLEVVEVGDLRLIGEIIRVTDDRATIQVYENTSGLKPGAPVFGTGRPLSVRLGPGLLRNIYDGIQRPLERIAEHSGAFLGRGEKPSPLDNEARWPFEPAVAVGDALSAGQIFARVQETISVEHRLNVPPGINGTVVEIADAGEYCNEDTVCRLQTDTDGVVSLTMCHEWPVRRPRPNAGRITMEMPLVTGLRVVDTFFPITQGGTAAIPGGFGTGKTMTQHALAKWSAAQIIVYIGCGERGNEMTEVLREFPELIDPRSGRSLMERTILIANTSNMPVAAREVSIYTGIAIAEYYRDMGYDVAVMADSTSRWAEALRELSGRLEEMPADEGFPAYLPSRLASFYERAGKVETLNGDTGSVSVIGAVSPPGGDFSEPVTQHTSRFIRCFWALDRDLANARHYPAISWTNSYSEYLPDITAWWQSQDHEWTTFRERLMEILQEEVTYQRIAKLVGPDALPDHQRLILLLADLIKNSFLQQNSFDDIDMYCAPAKQVWMLRTLVSFSDRCLQLIKRGATLADIREMECLTTIIRMKSTVPNDDAQAMTATTNAIGKELDELERRFA
ncbi:MAG: V-type ATP synthase subunit A [Lentisphaerae bacterium]|nr:V-type ATP synthase subunit A [Lentisphaerota bacterium]MBT4822005.1 V-type ATP synthase subunit A [Lentisphaerota bacterium]MBT5609551.1 V-type ATP synthase subunit A [Lentisphaerota bacterium]MBT7058457.1 V-type ATP synthase subunit A [Lentisphaerota bacterium]MBT7843166.1 V-type ATP synthase subunit A [Lentisphaerota bacterium]